MSAQPFRRASPAAASKGVITRAWAVSPVQVPHESTILMHWALWRGGHQGSLVALPATPGGYTYQLPIRRVALRAKIQAAFSERCRTTSLSSIIGMSKPVGRVVGTGARVAAV